MRVATWPVPGPTLSLETEHVTSHGKRDLADGMKVKVWSRGADAGSRWAQCHHRGASKGGGGSEAQSLTQGQQRLERHIVKVVDGHKPRDAGDPREAQGDEPVLQTPGGTCPVDALVLSL